VRAVHEASRLTLYVGRQESLHRALVRALRRDRDTRGATTVRGVWGYHGEHAPRGDGLLSLRRRVPVVT
jgi:PII-like signaling protein